MRVNVPIYLPTWAYKTLRHLRYGARNVPSNGLTLSGDRDIEWSFVVSRMPAGSGEALDFGASFGRLSISAAQKGYHVLALDLDPEQFQWKHPNVDFLCGDLLTVDLPTRHFDLILNCSSVEHVGLQGRYGVAVEETDGDLQAMQRFLVLMKPSGRMLLTIPCGRDAAIVPWHRVYGEQRLPRLLSSYAIEEEAFWMKHEDNRWYPSCRKEALSFVPTGHPTMPTLCSYALGCFVLKAVA